jgi:hypothetical protein
MFIWSNALVKILKTQKSQYTGSESKSIVIVNRYGNSMNYYTWSRNFIKRLNNYLIFLKQYRVLKRLYLWGVYPGRWKKHLRECIGLTVVAKDANHVSQAAIRDIWRQLDTLQRSRGHRKWARWSGKMFRLVLLHSTSVVFERLRLWVKILMRLRHLFSKSKFLYRIKVTRTLMVDALGFLISWDLNLW